MAKSPDLTCPTKMNHHRQTQRVILVSAAALIAFCGHVSGVSPLDQIVSTTTTNHTYAINNNNPSHLTYSIQPHAVSPHSSSQQHSSHLSSNTISQQQQQHNLDKFQRYLNERQHALIKKHPGSLMAVTRALKMAIYECQYQMRYEPWNCPIYGFSIKPAEIFGMLISRSFKETSFIQSLLSSALTHSVTRACTESTIATCRRRITAQNTYSEDIDFGRHFAEQFMDATHDSASSSSSSSHHSSNNLVPSNHHSYASSAAAAASALNSNSIVPSTSKSSLASTDQAPVWREREIRRYINAHNDEVGRLLVMYEMRRECKCHGLSGACSQQTCWLKLPPFRDVADKLHNSLEQAVKFYEAPKPSKRYKSMTSKLIKKSNKKRSSSSLSQAQSSSLVPTQTTQSRLSGANGPIRSTTLLTNADNSLNGVGGSVFESPINNISASESQQVQVQSDNDVSRVSSQHPLSSPSSTSASQSNNNENGGISPNGIYQSQNNELIPPERTTTSISQTTTTLSSSGSTTTTNSTYNVVKKRPIARSIGQTAPHPNFPSMSDLLYYEESPDFCVPSERYNIKGTRGRVCSEDPNESNSCKRLCCGRGYKTEVREEKYKCECKFKYCCKLYCNQCTRRKQIHKCL